MKEIKQKIKSPFFISMSTAAKFILPIQIFLDYLVSLDLDVTCVVDFEEAIVITCSDGKGLYCA
jgi:hypothetical protein